jgi:hypothetical protein
MKKLSMWMVLMAMAVSSLLAQVADTSSTIEQQQIEQAVEEAMVNSGEAVEAEPAAVGALATVSDEEEPVEKESSGHEYKQVQTLMTGSGGYGAISFGYTEINDLPAFQMGAQGEWVVGHGFGLGIAGVGFTSDFTPIGQDFYAISGGYGGLIMEPILFGWFPVHIALPVMIGGGGLASYTTTSDPWDYDNFNPTFGESDAFFVVEAGAELEFNLVRFFRLSLYANYRWTTDLKMKPMDGLILPSPYNVDPQALHGWSFGARFKFGSF